MGIINSVRGLVFTPNLALTSDTLIYDIGVNDGSDSNFYLRKGFHVIGVEANPALYKTTSQRLSKYIVRGQFIFLNLGLWSEMKELPFYLNIDNDHWSSFDPAYGCRNNTKYEVVNVKCVTFNDLIKKYGCPRYLKIDIEGADKLVLKSLGDETKIPKYISVEEYGVAAIDDLHKLGYTGFKIVPQRSKQDIKPPKPSREGRYCDYKFNGTNSGLFGLELPGAWLDYTEARSFYLTNVRTEDWTYVGPQHEWFDIHATHHNL